MKSIQTFLEESTTRKVLAHIAGPSGSGKTTIATVLAKNILT
jgi:uridine kinase